VDGKHPIVSAFTNVSRFELMLRRVIRWEMMRRFGRGWFINLGGVYDQISNRIIRDKKAGIYSNKSSELSYLGLTELSDLIFKVMWKDIFSKPFSHDRGLMNVILGSIVPLRNKVAHVREVDESDLINLKYAYEIRDQLRQYYDSTNIPFYFSSDPEYAAEQIDAQSLSRAKQTLEFFLCPKLLDEYSKFDSVRSRHIFPGFGVYDEHFFVELQAESLTFRNRILAWAERRSNEITLIVNSQSITRIYWPLVLGEAEIRRQLTALHNSLMGHISSPYSQNERLEKLEFFVTYDKEFNVGFAF